MRVLVQRAIPFARDSRFCLCSENREGSVCVSRKSKEQNIERASRCKRTLTLTLSLTGRGDYRSSVIINFAERGECGIIFGDDIDSVGREA